MSSLLSSEHVPAYQEGFRYRRNSPINTDSTSNVSDSPSPMSAYINEEFKLRRRSSKKMHKIFRVFLLFFLTAIILYGLFSLCGFNSSNCVKSKIYTF